MENITIKFFGAFQKYVPNSEVDLNLNFPLTTSELRNEIYSYLIQLNSGFNEKSLLEESRLATEDSLLDENDVIISRKIALLPPVCGG